MLNTKVKDQVKKESSRAKLIKDENFVEIPLDGDDQLQMKSNERQQLLQPSKEKRLCLPCFVRFLLIIMLLLLFMGPGTVICDRLRFLECKTKCPELWFPLFLIPIPVILACMPRDGKKKMWLMSKITFVHNKLFLCFL